MDSKKLLREAARFNFQRPLVLALVLLPLLTLDQLRTASGVWANTITGVSGSITHGNSITILGTGFGVKGGSDPNKPLIWADFETSDSPTSLGVITSWHVNYDHGTANESYGPLVRTTGGIQYGISASNMVGTWPGIDGRLLDFRLQLAMTKVYMYGKRRWTHMGYGGSGVKYFRIYNNTGGDVVASTANNGWFGDEGCFSSGNNQRVTFPLNVWHTHEFLWKQSTSSNCGADTGNGYFEFIQNGIRLQFSNTFATHTSATFGQGNGLRLFDNYNAPQDSFMQPDGAKVYQDDLYLDDTWARVMIGNASTFAASTIREVQIPTSWSDGSIKVQINRGSFGASASAWLYVIDRNNVPSAGLPITFGGGASSTTLLDAPHNLTVSIP